MTEQPLFRWSSTTRSSTRSRPADRDDAPGWRDAGFQGTQPECLDHIERVWTTCVRSASAEPGEPPMTQEMTAQLTDLTPEQRELLRQRLAGAPGAPAAAAALLHAGAALVPRPAGPGDPGLQRAVRRWTSRPAGHRGAAPGAERRRGPARLAAAVFAEDEQGHTSGSGRGRRRAAGGRSAGLPAEQRRTRADGPRSSTGWSRST